MIQTIDFAPLDGITKIVFRQVWSQFFGGVDRYFIPFFSPTPHHLMTPRDLREVDYIHNAALPSVPQVMTKNANDFLWTCDVLKDMGYTEVNLNLGCPSGTVTAKGKGSGFLAHPDELAAFFDEVFSKIHCRYPSRPGWAMRRRRNLPLCWTSITAIPSPVSLSTLVCGRKNTGGLSIWTYLLTHWQTAAILCATTAIYGQWARSGPWRADSRRSRM